MNGMRVRYFALLASIAASVALAQHAKIAPGFEHAAANDPVNVIVQFREAPVAAHHAKILAHGGTHRATLHVVKGGAYTVRAGALEALAEDPDVVAVSPDHPLRATGTEQKLDYFRETVNATQVQSLGYTGHEIGVAVIDSGLFAQDDLPRIVHRESFVPGNTTRTGTDPFGHGTHVAGIIGGNGKRSSDRSATYTFGGIAPGVNLIDLRVLDANGNGTDSAVIAAIQRAIELKRDHNIRVINLSLGRPVTQSYTADPLCQAVEAAWQAGIVVVAAAGNEGRNNSANTTGYGTIFAPGNDPYVITVGAMKSTGTRARGDDLVASYSSKGPTLIDHIVKPDLVAPGNLIVSTSTYASATLPTLYPQSQVVYDLYKKDKSGPSPDYFILSGSSMATPMVTGTVALMLEKDPDLTPDVVKARLMKTASKSFPSSSVATDPTTGISYTSYYDIFTIGAGYLDALAAVTNWDSGSGVSTSPTAVFDHSSKTVSLVTTGAGVIWGSGVIWGTGLVWGTNVFTTGTTNLAGAGLVWGTQNVSGFGVIWGAGKDAGTAIIWDTSGLEAEGFKLLVQGEN